MTDKDLQQLAEIDLVEEAYKVAWELEKGRTGVKGVHYKMTGERLHEMLRRAVEVEREIAAEKVEEFILPGGRYRLLLEEIAAAIREEK